MTKDLYITLLTTISVLSALTSCEYKELEEPDRRTDVTLSMDFSSVDSIPNSVRVSFYPIGNEITYTPSYFDLPKSIWTNVSGNTWQAQVKIPQGYYDVVAWNNDTEHVITDGINNQMTLTATTPEYSSRGSFNTHEILDSIYNGQKVLDYPDYMVHAISTDNEITTEYNEVKLKQDSMVISVQLRINGIAGLSTVKQVRGTINNVAGKRYVAYPNKTEENVAVIFDCNCNAQDSVVYANFYLFGLEPTETTKTSHKMVLFFWLDEAKIYLPIDITKYINQYSKEDKRINLTTPPLNIDLRDYFTSKNTFDVNVETWDNIDINVGF